LSRECRVVYLPLREPLVFLHEIRGFVEHLDAQVYHVLKPGEIDQRLVALREVVCDVLASFAPAQPTFAILKVAADSYRYRQLEKSNVVGVFIVDSGLVALGSCVSDNEL
jgi:hypothetical protein